MMYTKTEKPVPYNWWSMESKIELMPMRNYHETHDLNSALSWIHNNHKPEDVIVTWKNTDLPKKRKIYVRKKIQDDPPETNDTTAADDYLDYLSDQW